MSFTDRLRIESAVQRYDFWLELKGVRGKSRRELRRELRANLREASADVGTTRALFGIGSPRELADNAIESDPSRPLWSLGALWAALAFGVVMIACLFTAITFLAGVEASGVVGETVRGSVFPWFGVDFSARVEPDRGGIAAGAGGIGWYFLGVPLLTFVLVSQPWRLMRRHPTTSVASTDRG